MGKIYHNNLNDVNIPVYMGMIMYFSFESEIDVHKTSSCKVQQRTLKKEGGCNVVMLNHKGPRNYIKLMNYTMVVTNFGAYCLEVWP